MSARSTKARRLRVHVGVCLSVGLLLAASSRSDAWAANPNGARSPSSIDRRVFGGPEIARLLNDNPVGIARRRQAEVEAASLSQEKARDEAERQKDIDDAEAEKRRVENQKVVEEEMKMAQVALEAHDYAGADEHAGKVVALDPKANPYAYVILGDVQLDSTKNYGKALELYKKAMEADPNDGWAVNRASQALVKLKRPVEARNLLRSWLEQHPDRADGDTYDALAWMELDLGDAKKALEAFRNAESVSKGRDAEAYYGMAMLAARRNDPKETERTLDALFTLEPERRVVIERDPTFFRIRMFPNVRALFSDKKLAESRLAAANKKKGEPAAKPGHEGSGPGSVVASNDLKISVPGGRDKTIAEQIRFDFNSAALRPESRAVLDEIAEFLRSESKNIDVVVITGHADKQGDEAYNVKLSEQRALSVKTALASRGVNGALLQTKGYGAYCPLDDGDTPESFEKNRRVQFAISAGGRVSGEELSCIDRMRKWLKPDLTTEKLIKMVR